MEKVSTKTKTRPTKKRKVGIISWINRNKHPEDNPPDEIRLNTSVAIHDIDANLLEKAQPEAEFDGKFRLNSKNVL